jgi:hypothetical protein
MLMADRNDTLMEQVISHLNLELGVFAVSWKAAEDGAS